MSVLEIDLRNPDQLNYVVELLRSLKFVEDVRVRSETLEEPVAAEPQQFLSAKHWGSWQQNPLTIEKIDYEIRKMRDEWDRDIYRP